MATTLSSIVDNLGENTLLHALETRTERGQELCVATAFFSLDALNLLGPKLKDYDRIRLLFGDDANATQRAKLLQAMREKSDEDLRDHREKQGLPEGLKHAADVIKAGRFEARCYTREKFHAKAYLVAQPFHPPLLGIIGSGNFTRPGLTKNIELNVDLTMDQSSQLRDWFEARWAEAAEDDVTEQVAKEIKRQIDLYDPYVIYQKALLAWGAHRQGDIRAEDTLRIRDALDPHQELGYRRALQILQRENGVMICDGVGLGKSYIALALMEHFCARKKNVLLVAPKSIMESSWNTYLAAYLSEYRQPFGSIEERYMTDFGFEYDEDEVAATGEREAELRKLIERADVVVVDESHNFRTRSSQRYQNLYRVVAPQDAAEGGKKIVLLTATPVNTSYHDLSAQLELITHDRGTVSGYSGENIRSATKALDADAKARGKHDVQPDLDFDGINGEAGATVSRILESVFIQRKRSTCIALANAVGKELLFPKREKPIGVEYEISDSFKAVVALAQRRFSPIAAFIQQMQEEYRKAQERGIEFKPPKMPTKSDGIKLAAFLPEQYRIAGPRKGRAYQVEAFLAKMVFVNTLKQLESSPPAWQGIIQSLGAGLIARLKYVFGDDAMLDIRPHGDWVRTPIHAIERGDVEGAEDEGDLAEANGTELDNWLEQAVAERHLHHKLGGFTAEEFNRDKWRRDILRDLAFLKEIHDETMRARQVPDYKLETAVREIAGRVDAGRRIVVFTQSQRTAFYLENALSTRLPRSGVARIDSNVKQEARDEILYSFCPNYNPEPRRLFHRGRVDVLICTDVLSEGVNLQEAECILNYDIHWNPVRLIQRIGRVDRRLDPAKNPDPHTIDILNFLPPDEIDGILSLVSTVESRRQIIFNTMGLDQAFFKSNDPDGTLKEFNAQVDGEPTVADRLNDCYIRAVAEPDPAIRKLAEEMPPGAFGVWDTAPVDGVFALFEMKPSDRTAQADRARFKSTLGMPVLALQTSGKPKLEAAAILDLLSATVPGEKSGDPGDPEALKKALVALRNAANQSFRDINLVSTIQPRLVCWMELRKTAAGKQQVDNP